MNNQYNQRELREIITLTKISITLHNQYKEYNERMQNFTISEKEYKRVRKIAMYKLERHNKVREKIKSLKKKMNMSARDAMAIRTYGMTFDEVEKVKGKDKREWGRNLEIMYQIFRESCY